MARNIFPKDELSGDYSVVKNNSLITARYKLSLAEQRLILTLMSKIKADDKTLMEYELDIQDFFELLGMSSDKNHAALKNTCKELAGRVVSIDTGNGFIAYSWLHHVEYLEKQGRVILQLHEYLKPFLLWAKENVYTKYTLGMALSFTSAYTIRVYELMKQYENLRQREISIKDFKLMLGITGSEYKQYANLKEKIIEKSINEINDKSDLLVTYKEIKDARKVVALSFTLKENWQNTHPVTAWYDAAKYKAKSIDELAKLLSKELKQRYDVMLKPEMLTLYTHTALLVTLFELKEGYYQDIEIKAPLPYFMAVLANKSLE